MIPPDSMIQEWAYYQWERRGGRHGQDVKDWLDAEQHLRLALNYRVIFRRFLDRTPKVALGKDKGRCRYCGRGKEKTTFKKIAHSLPEFLGNKSIISKDECDKCNDFFSSNIEDHLAKMMMPMRTVLGISGKSGVPTFKSKSKKVRFEHDTGKHHITLRESVSERIMTVDSEAKTISLKMTCQPHIPVATFKCFTKIALAIMPDNELKHYDIARRWVLHPDHSLNEELLRGLGCYLYSTPTPYVEPWVMLLRRDDPSARLPYMLLLLGTSHLLFQTLVPMCYLDNHLERSEEPLPRFASHLMPRFGVLPVCQTIPMSSPYIKHDQTFAAIMTYEEAFDLPDSPAGDPPFEMV